MEVLVTDVGTDSLRVRAQLPLTMEGVSWRVRRKIPGAFEVSAFGG